MQTAISLESWKLRRNVFAEQGFNASMKSVAARANVGVGTLYRRFPAKTDLFDAVLSTACRRLQQIAQQVMTDVPAEEAAFEFIRRCVGSPSVWRASTSIPPWGSKGEAWLTESAPILEEIVAMSKRVGTLRGDIDATNVVMTLKAVRSIADLCDSPEVKPSLRFLELILDGLRV